MSGEYETFYVAVKGFDFSEIDRGLEQLHNFVNEALNEGFRPVGGPVMASHRDYLFVTQAVVRYKPVDPTDGFALSVDDDGLTGELPF